MVGGGRKEKEMGVRNGEGDCLVEGEFRELDGRDC